MDPTDLAQTGRGLQERNVRAVFPRGMTHTLISILGKAESWIVGSAPESADDDVFRWGGILTEFRPAAAAASWSCPSG